jgi:hypothetical protein
MLDPMFVVWDPIRDSHWNMKAPEIKFDSWTATVLCGDARCDHLRCECSGSFLVVFIAVDTAAGLTSAFCYRQDSNTWAQAATTNSAVVLNIKPAVLISESLFFRTLDTEGRILRYNVLADRLSFINPATMDQVPCRDFILLPGNDGRLLLRQGSTVNTAIVGDGGSAQQHSRHMVVHSQLQPEPIKSHSPSPG